MKFIQIVAKISKNVQGLGLQNYHAISPNIMNNAGYKTDVVIHSTDGIYTNKQLGLNNDISVKYISGLRYILYLIKNRNNIIFSNSRVPQSLIAGIFGGKRTVFMSHTEVLPAGYRKYILKFFLKFFRKIRVATPYGKQKLIELGINPTRIFIVPHVIDVDLFFKKTNKNLTYKKYKLNKNNINLITISNMRKIKYPHVLLNAIKILSKKYPNIQLIIVGRDLLHEQGLKSVKEQAKELGISDKIIMLGHIKHSNIPPLLQICDIMVFSSKAEGQCQIAYEGIAAGNALCVSRIGSFTSVFPNSALFHNYTDSKQLAKNIEKYLSKTKLAKKHVTENRTILKNYMYGVVSKKLLKLFEVW
jgi:glycosyltransferase involved in cell wall biosynthesis